jgi:thioesterase domain-containing protein/acyl carrier protein
MYTSGSTGRPKAVAVPHRAVLRLIRHADYVTITPADVMAQASVVSFDAATFEIWGALLNGARLVVLPRDIVLTPAELAAALARHGVTLLFLTTALFNQVSREVPTAFRSLRTLLVGGEVAEPRCFAAVLQAGPPRRLVNVYGPTETTTFASWYPVERVPDGTTSIPIGRPITNTQLYVLERRGNPAPIGVPGELFIGGPGVARGYQGRPDLTAERFLPNPFSAEPGARLYKTGDLVRYLPHGAIEFLGRSDHQVKIRGHRIEPGEVEAALRQHPAVREALVLAREDEWGDRRLVAYVSPAAPEVTPGGLRAFLRERLPAYMIPARFALLERLPLTMNGKVDRGKLPEPGAALGEERANFTTPQDPLEDLLAQIWEDTLAVRPIGVHDEFFDLGGHSLLAVRLIDAIERALGQRIPVTTLFEHRTVRQLAQALVRQRGKRSESRMTAIHPGGSRARFFFLHGDFNGGGFYCHRLAQVLGREQPFIALHPHGLDGGPVPPSIEAMATDQIDTVRSLQPRGPYLLGGHCNGSLVAFEMARRLRAQGERVDLLFLVDLPIANIGARARLLAALKGRARRIRNALRGALGAGNATLLPDGVPRSRERLYADYLQAIGSYIPRRYAGAVTLVVAKDAGKDAAQQGRSDLMWRTVAPNVRIHVTPGDHLTCITRHAAALGEFLAACLADVQPKVRHPGAAE